MFDCLIITKKCKRQLQEGEWKENSAIMNKSRFYLRQCIEQIEGKKFESLDMALENTPMTTRKLTQ
jgi:hypothetical protein